jgi:hypothetical protein
MNLTTERLLLRNYKTEDWEWVHIYGSDSDFSKYELWSPNTLEDTHKFIALRRFSTFYCLSNEFSLIHQYFVVV